MTETQTTGFTEKSTAQAWHALEARSVLDKLGVDGDRGLSASEAARRLQEYGPNIIETGRKVRWYVVFGRQFVDPLVAILVVAAGLSVAMGHFTDAAAILVIVVLNGLLGFIQEWKAERAIEALQRMLSPHCRVIRSGIEREIDAAELVPGDIVALEAGDRAPADVRLIKALNLEVDEAPLTGESMPVEKATAPVDTDADLAARSSMAWMGTAVTNGWGKGAVVNTGMATQFGRIAALTAGIGDETTPLQMKLARLGKGLGVVALAIAAIIGAAGVLAGNPPLEMFQTAVALAVAVVPEGLPAVVTITLALGIRAMARRRALLRRLQSAETLGSATVILTDKTGTLTKNEMTVTRVWLGACEVEVTGVGYEPAGIFKVAGQGIDPEGRPDLEALLETGLVCNHAQLVHEEGAWRIIGDPTEGALIVAARKAGLEAGHRETVGEFSFDSRRQRMTVLERRAGEIVAHVKGAPEVILDRCRRIQDGPEERSITEEDKTAFAHAYEAMAQDGLRTLALARRNLQTDANQDAEAVERELTLLGMVAIIDPARPEAPNAVKLAGAAGIRVTVVTGDAAGTATAVARQIGLTVDRVVTGREFERMSEDDLHAALEQPGVLFARATPEQKLRIAGMLQDLGHVVAMTGDGVNDAPALKKAAIGIAMGRRGTDVAKSASDMILTDDNFASIVGAVEEGRRQYENIQKFVRYLLSSNSAEVVAIFVNVLLGGPLIFLPVQILWMNLVTDSMTAVALGVEPAEKDAMRRRPRRIDESPVGLAGLAMVVLLGGYMGLANLWLFHHYLARGAGEQAVVLARTMAFVGLIIAEKVNVFNFRSLRSPMPIVGFLTNPWVLLAWTGTVGLQVFAVYVPFMRRVLHIAPLGWADWGWIILLAAPVFISTEAVKWVRWWLQRHGSTARPSNMAE